MKKAAFIKRTGHNSFAFETVADALAPKQVESKWAAYAAGRFIPIANLGKPIVVYKKHLVLC